MKKKRIDNSRKYSKKTDEFAALYLKASPQMQDKVKRRVFAAYAKMKYLERKSLE